VKRETTGQKVLVTYLSSPSSSWTNWWLYHLTNTTAPLPPQFLPQSQNTALHAAQQVQGCAAPSLVQVEHTAASLSRRDQMCSGIADPCQ
jgi:hypothetical protein